MNYKKYTLYGQENPRLVKELEENGFVHDDNNPEYVFSLGGDGTMLGAVHKYMDKDNVKFVGINYGKLGFYTDFVKDEVSVAEVINSAAYTTEEFRLIELRVNDKRYYALNEIVVMNPMHTQNINILVDGMMLEVFRGTGIVLSTPSGSTAYNKSLGGSILAPSIEGYQLTEIASINNRIYKTLSSSLVLSKKNIVMLEFDETDGLIIQVDGQQVNEDGYKKVEIKLSNKNIKLITKAETGFLERVRKSFLE